MPVTPGKKSGKKNRKFGRNAKRSPAMARYRGEQRYFKNKRLRQEREQKKRRKKALKLLRRAARKAAKPERYP